MTNVLLAVVVIVMVAGGVLTDLHFRFDRLVKLPFRSEDRPPLADDLRAFYTEIVSVPPLYAWMEFVPGYEPERKQRFFILQCGDCGDVHGPTCPRVASKSFHENGQLASVTYLAKWDRSQSIRLEDVFSTPEVVGAR